MRTIRRILLTEYIGAILIALLVADAISTLLGVIAQQLAYHAYMHRYKQMTDLLLAERWNTTLTSAVKIVLYLTSAHLLARWLYSTPNNIPSDSGDQTANAQ